MGGGWGGRRGGALPTECHSCCLAPLAVLHALCLTTAVACLTELMVPYPPSLPFPALCYSALPGAAAGVGAGAAAAAAAQRCQRCKGSGGGGAPCLLCLLCPCTCTHLILRTATLPTGRARQMPVPLPAPHPPAGSLRLPSSHPSLPPSIADSLLLLLFFFFLSSPQVRAGTGGDEACLFAQELFRMYDRYAAAQGWKFEVGVGCWVLWGGGWVLPGGCCWVGWAGSNRGCRAGCRSHLA